jgi:hypothetical protein
MILDEMYRYMVGIQGNSLMKVPLEEVAKGQRQIPHDDPLIKTARAVGTCLAIFEYSFRPGQSIIFIILPDLSLI